MLLLWMVGAAVAAVPGTQTTVAPPAASLADTFVPPPPARIPVPASGVPGSLLDRAQKTLLFDPVFRRNWPTAAGRCRRRAGPGCGEARHSANGFVVEAVTARNADGEIIRSLRKEDFAVTEDGNTQEVSLFDFEKVERLAAAAPPLAPAAADRALPRLPHAGLAAESKDQLRYKDHRLVVLYFDMTSMQTPDQLRALDAAQKFIGTQMSSVDMLCLMRNAGAGSSASGLYRGSRPLAVGRRYAGGRRDRRRRCRACRFRPHDSDGRRTTRGTAGCGGRCSAG